MRSSPPGAVDVQPGGHADPSEAPSLSTFESIFDTYFEYVWSSLRRLGVMERDLDDVSQEVFLTIYRRLTTFDASRPVKPWIFGIAYNLSRDYRRLARHRREVLVPPPERPAASPPPDEKLERAEAQALVIQALQGIDERRRAIFILHEIDGVSMKEVAESLSIPMHTGYSRLRKAREEFARSVRQVRLMRCPS